MKVYLVIEFCVPDSTEVHFVCASQAMAMRMGKTLLPARRRDNTHWKVDHFTDEYILAHTGIYIKEMELVGEFEPIIK